MKELRQLLQQRADVMRRIPGRSRKQDTIVGLANLFGTTTYVER